MKHKEARAEIQYHKRFIQKEIKKVPDPRYSIIGERMHSPPSPLPASASVQICKKHWPLKKTPSRCERCKAVKSMKQPVLPCTFFTKFRARIVLDVPAAEKISDGKGGFLEVYDDIVFDTSNEGGLRPMLKTSLGERTPVEIVAMALDANNNYWINYSRYFDKKSLDWMQYTTKENFLNKWEVLKESETHWAQLDDIAGSCFVIESTRQEFRDRLKRKLLPNMGRVYFTRENFSATYWENKQLRRERRARMRADAEEAARQKESAVKNVKL